MRRTASPFGLYRPSTALDFNQDVLDEFDDIKPKETDELKLQSFGILSGRPKKLAIRLGKTGEHA